RHSFLTSAMAADGEAAAERSNKLRGRRGLAALVAVLSTVFVFGTRGAATNTTFIYAGAADPTYLDPAIVSDGESFRIARQIFDTLVQLKPGTTILEPALAKSWRHS